MRSLFKARHQDLDDEVGTARFGQHVLAHVQDGQPLCGRMLRRCTHVSVSMCVLPSGLLQPSSMHIVMQDVRSWQYMASVRAADMYSLLCSMRSDSWPLDALCMYLRMPPLRSAITIMDRHQ